MEDNFRFVNCNERRSTEYRWLIARRKEGALIRGGGVIGCSSLVCRTTTSCFIKLSKASSWGAPIRGKDSRFDGHHVTVDLEETSSEYIFRRKLSSSLREGIGGKRNTKKGRPSH